MKEKRRRSWDVTTGPKASGRENVDPIEREIRAEHVARADEARDLRLDIAIQRRKNALEELKGKQVTKKEISNTGSNVLQGIMNMASVDPARAKEFLNSLSQEDIMKINMVATSGSGGNMMPFMPFLQNKDTKIQDIVAIVKMMQPSPEKPTTISEVATLLKALKEDKEAPQADPIEIAMKYLKPMYDMASTKDKQFYTAELENTRKQNVDPIEWIKSLKEVAPMLGFVPADNTGQNLELAKMKIDADRYVMEHNWKVSKELAELTQQKQSDKDRLELIKEVSGPALKALGPILDKIVNSGKQRKRASPRAGNVSDKEAATAFICPECAINKVETVIDISKNPDVIVCPTCKKEFKKQE